MCRYVWQQPAAAQPAPMAASRPLPDPQVQCRGLPQESSEGRDQPVPTGMADLLMKQSLSSGVGSAVRRLCFSVLRGGDGSVAGRLSPSNVPCSATFWGHWNLLRCSLSPLFKNAWVFVQQRVSDVSVCMYKGGSCSLCWEEVMASFWGGAVSILVGLV